MRRQNGRKKKREEWQKKEEKRKKEQPTLDEELEEYIEEEVVSNEWRNRKTRREKEVEVMSQEERPCKRRKRGAWRQEKSYSWGQEDTVVDRNRWLFMDNSQLERRKKTLQPVIKPWSWLMLESREVVVEIARTVEKMAKEKEEKMKLEEMRNQREETDRKQQEENGRQEKEKGNKQRKPSTGSPTANHSLSKIGILKMKQTNIKNFLSDMPGVATVPDVIYITNTNNDIAGAQGVELSSLMKVQQEVGEATSNNSSYVVESCQDTLSSQHRLSKDNDKIYICPGNPPDPTRIQEGSGGGKKLPSQVDYEEEKTGYMVDKVPENKQKELLDAHHENPNSICTGNHPDLPRIQERSGGGKELPGQVNRVQEKTGYMADKVPGDGQMELMDAHQNAVQRLKEIFEKRCQEANVSGDSRVVMRGKKGVVKEATVKSMSVKPTRKKKVATIEIGKERKMGLVQAKIHHFTRSFGEGRESQDKGNLKRKAMGDNMLEVKSATKRRKGE